MPKATPLWRRNPTVRFRDRARDYARYRPTYPPAAVDALLRGLGPPLHLRAVDVGAGTGIASRLLARRGVSVIAVEPNRVMRRAARSHARVRYVAGRAEETGLPGAAFDLVFCAQAFHWFEPRAALREFRRVLRPGGRLVILWNQRVEADPFSAAYGRLIRAGADGTPTEARWRGLTSRLKAAQFTDVRRQSFPHAQSLTLRSLVGQARSISYVPLHGPARAALAERLRALQARFADKSGRMRVAYRTLVFSATAPPSATRARPGSPGVSRSSRKKAARSVRPSSPALR